MVISAKSRSRRDLVAEPDADGGMNDNNPGMHPGHELSDLRNVPRQPAAEAVIHYARFAAIKSFPDHPQAAPAALADAPPMDADVGKAGDKKAPVKRWVALACLGSAVFHVAVLAALVIGFVATPEEPVEEAGETVSVIILGDSEADQAAVGEEQDEPQPEPDEVVAEPVQPETVQPTTAEPVQAEAVQPTQAVTRVSPETVTAAEPEVLTSQAPAETSVVQPMATAIPEEVTPEVQPAETQPTTAVVPEEVKPVEPVETAEALPDPPAPEEVVTPTPRPKLQEQAAKPKPVEKKPEPPKKVRTAAGSKGENQQDSRRGSVDGQKTADSDRNSRSAGSRNGAGSAAVANYPGKVQSRIRRAVRVPTEYKRMGGAMSVRVRLTIGGSGALTSLAVARSSGIAELDQAVIEGVRRAAPFPPLPSEWGKPSWSFTQEVQVTGR
jgi:protein TonB